MANQLPEFLRLKYIDWQAKSRQNRTLKSFALYLGVGAQLLSMWMNGTRTPGPENIDLLAAKLGPEVYDALELPRPDPHLQKLVQIWHLLPEEARRNLREQGERFADQNENDPRTQTLRRPVDETP
jgi:transcriptional regulator with XRE-family HTH domain